MASQVKPSFDILLIGKTGHGKSATGNSIIDRRFFKSSSNAASVTFDVSSTWTERENCIIKVIDGPGIGETRLKLQEAVKKSTTDMANAMTHVTKGFHAMVLVYKFGQRFTKEEQDSIDFLKGMLGQDVFVKYGVCVMTCGDNFLDAMEEDETPEMTPLQWCMNQDSKGSKFTAFLKECGNRIVLFDNKSRDPQVKHRQVEELLRLIRGLPNGGVRYTNEKFVLMHDERQKLILRAELPQLEEDIQMKCSLLKEAMGKIKLDQPDAVRQVADLKKKANALVSEIYAKDKGTLVLIPLKSIVDSILLIIEKYEVERGEKKQEILKKNIERIEREQQDNDKRNEEVLKVMEDARAEQKENMIKIQNEFKVKEGEYDRNLKAMEKRANERSKGKGECIIL